MISNKKLCVNYICRWIADPSTWILVFLLSQPLQQINYHHDVSMIIKNIKLAHRISKYQFPVMTDDECNTSDDISVS